MTSSHPVISSLTRRVTAEAVGTAFLLAAVIGSGIAAQRLSPHEVGLQLLENSLITGAALVALILALQPVSATFNPVVTVVERGFGAISTGEAAALVAAQLAGGLVGAVVANVMFSEPALSIATRHRTGGGLWLGEVIAGDATGRRRARLRPHPDPLPERGKHDRPRLRLLITLWSASRSRSPHRRGRRS